MSCLTPVQAYRSKLRNASGKRSVVFNRDEGLVDLPVQFACGKCKNCRLRRSKEWAIRCVHEASLHARNSFITLTYRPKDRPDKLTHFGELGFQRFMKRLRKAVSPHRVRFYMCGEYTPINRYPHFHAILFGYDFPDRKKLSIRNGNQLYISEQLTNLWPFGYHVIAENNFKTAAYVARYIMDKKDGDLATEYEPYACMSRNPGIGHDWWQSKGKYDLALHDFCVLDGKKMQPPKYYDNLFINEDEHSFNIIRHTRKRLAKKREDDNLPERIEARWKCSLARVKLLKRELEQ